MIVLALLAAPAPWLGHAADADADADSTNKTLFLPKSPRAAAYVLGRLTNKELIEAPRSEFVYVALLERKGLDKKYRVEALEGLAKLRGTDPVTEMLGGIRALDQKGEESAPVLRDLAALLLQVKSADLATKRAELEKLATESQQPVTRQIGFAGMVTADGSPDQVWQQQSGSAPALRSDLLLAVPLMRDANLRAAFYPKIEPLLHQAEPAELRRAAITAVVATPGHDAETFAALSALAKSGIERAAAIASLERIPRKAWPPDQAGPLIESLAAYLRSVPADQRTQPEAISALQFASELSSLLPADQAKAVGQTLRGLGVSVVVVRTILEQMLYDKTRIVVEAGKPVEIILINDDAMPHNLVVIAPGALEAVGTAAEKMPPEPDAHGRQYIPATPQVLYATPLVDPGQQRKLDFTAPETPGDYQYVCTFPGHWRRMVGTLAVVTDVEAYLASHPASAEPKVTEWKLEDLASGLDQSGASRNLAAGRELFTRLACAQCHKLGTEGYAYGPELTDVFKRYNNNRAEVLHQILEPSLVIADRYRNYQFELADGDEAMGMIVTEDNDHVTIQTGASAALIQTLKKADIKQRVAQKSSLMPVGLLNTLTQDQILDLLAFLESGGAIQTHEHKH